jgi:hypothetical protein
MKSPETNPFFFLKKIFFKGYTVSKIMEILLLKIKLNEKKRGFIKEFYKIMFRIDKIF